MYLYFFQFRLLGINNFLILLKFHFLRLKFHRKRHYAFFGYSAIPLIHHFSTPSFCCITQRNRIFLLARFANLWRPYSVLVANSKRDIPSFQRKKFSSMALMMSRSHLLRYFCKEEFLLNYASVDVTVNLF